MTDLDSALADYPRLRRALGFALVRDEKLLVQFLGYLRVRDVTTITVEHSVAWVKTPDKAGPSWLSFRMSVVRGFAAYLRTIDPATEVPPPNLFAGGSQRRVPYLYSDADVAALMTATTGLRYPLGVATYQTLIGLLTVTGMRIGEALRLDIADLDAERGLLVVRKSKQGRSRLVPLHPTTVAALVDYLARRHSLKPCPDVSGPAMFISTAGTRLAYVNFSVAFTKLARRAGLRPRSAMCRPRPHDLRHTMAVRTLVDWYRDGGDVASRLPLLSAVMGHTDPKSTYWYLDAAPELLTQAVIRLERHTAGPR